MISTKKGNRKSRRKETFQDLLTYGKQSVKADDILIYN